MDRTFTLVIALLIITPLALAKPFSLPENAREVAPGVFYLGQAQDHGRTVEGYAFVRYAGDASARGHAAKPEGKGKPGGSTTSSCYAVLAKGARWKSVEPWMLNPTNSHGLSSSFLVSTVDNANDQWEAAGPVNIFGAGSSTNAPLSADSGSPDGLNEVYFGEIAQSGVIAVTTTWGIFGGPPSGRELVEWDQVYDDGSFSWSASGEPGKMDFWNIAQHELGHALGLGHPSNDCTEETMYAYAANGETKKQSLNAGDIAGVKSLY